MTWVMKQGTWTTSLMDYNAFVHEQTDTDYYRGNGAWRIRCPKCRQPLPPVDWDSVTPFFKRRSDVWDYVHECGTIVVVEE